MVNYHFPGSFAGEKMKIKVVGKKMCTRQSRKVKWDMITVPDTVAVEPTFVA